DADLRRPTFNKILHKAPGPGLSSILAGHTEQDVSSLLGEFDGVPGLSILCSGPVPPYPSELLGSNQMRALLEQWRSEFDFILFDSAPILPVTDSVILSDLVDAKLLVARFGATERQSVGRSYSLLCGGRAEDKKVSLVVNAVE